MTPSRIFKVEAVFALLSALPKAEREERLVAECGSDEALYVEVKRLLDAPVSSGWEAFLREDVAALGDPVDLPESIGPYRIVDLINSGGYSVVYLGQAGETRAAVKVLAKGDAFSHKRFLDESLILKAVAHPYIPKLLGSGVHDGSDYIAMEYVPGLAIDVFAARHGLDLRGRVRLMVKVCEAMHAAHERKVIHRDLKPSNILAVETAEGLEPRIIDFGIAHALEALGDRRSAVTKLDHVIGSAGYMPPEQLSGGASEIDRRLDVYALGAVLYELITGKPPVPPTAAVATEGAAKEAAPPSSLLDGADAIAPELLKPRDRAALKRDLDWVILKAIKPRRNDRYPDAAAFAEDLRRFLGGRPVRARPPSFAYTWGTYVRTHWRETALVGTLAVALIGSAVGISTMHARSQWSLYVENIRRSQQMLDTGSTPDAVAALNVCPPSLRGWEFDLMKAATTPRVSYQFGFRHLLVQPMDGNVLGVPSSGSLVRLDGDSLKPLSSTGPSKGGNRRFMAWSPASLLAVGLTDADGGREFWMARLDKQESPVPLAYSTAWGSHMTWAEISPDERWVAVSSWKQPLGPAYCALYRASDGSRAWEREGTTIGGFDGDGLLMNGDNGVFRCALDGTAGGALPAVPALQGRWSISQEPSGHWLLVAPEKRAVLLDRAMTRVLADVRGRIAAADTSSDGSLLAVADGTRLRLFSTPRGIELPAIGSCAGAVSSLAFSGDALIVGCVSGRCESFDVSRVRSDAVRPPDRVRSSKRATEQVFELPTMALRVRTDGTTIRCERRTGSDTAFTEFAAFAGARLDATTVDAEKGVLAVAVPTAVRVVDLSTGRVVHEQAVTAQVKALAIDPSGSRLAVGTLEGLQVLAIGGSPGASARGFQVTALGWAGDDRLLVATDASRIEVRRDDDLATIVSLTTPEPVEVLQVEADGLRATGASKLPFYWRTK